MESVNEAFSINISFWAAFKILPQKYFSRHLTPILITMKPEVIARPWYINPLNAELIPMCHLLILLEDLTFMGKCIVSISNKMQRHTVYLYLETALYVLGGTSTNHQERIQLYLQHLVFVTPLLLSAAIVEELEPVWVCCGWHTPPTAHSNRFQLFHDSVSSNGVVANTRCCRYSCIRSWWWVEVPPEIYRAVSRYK
jgi:hypothetical protein